MKGFSWMFFLSYSVFLADSILVQCYEGGDAIFFFPSSLFTFQGKVFTGDGFLVVAGVIRISLLDIFNCLKFRMLIVKFSGRTVLADLQITGRWRNFC